MDILRDRLSEHLQEAFTRKIEEGEEDKITVEFYNKYYKIFSDWKMRNPDTKTNLEPLKHRLRKLISEAFIVMAQGKADRTYKAEFFEKFYMVFDEITVPPKSKWRFF